jgi:hypothetical protein
MSPDLPGTDCNCAAGSLSFIKVRIQQIAITPERKIVHVSK